MWVTTYHVPCNHHVPRLSLFHILLSTTTKPNTSPSTILLHIVVGAMLVIRCFLAMFLRISLHEPKSSTVLNIGLFVFWYSARRTWWVRFDYLAHFCCLLLLLIDCLKVSMEVWVCSLKGRTPLLPSKLSESQSHVTTSSEDLKMAITTNISYYTPKRQCPHFLKSPANHLTSQVAIELIRNLLYECFLLQQFQAILLPTTWLLSIVKSSWTTT